MNDHSRTGGPVLTRGKSGLIHRYKQTRVPASHGCGASTVSARWDDYCTVTEMSGLNAQQFNAEQRKSVFEIRETGRVRYEGETLSALTFAQTKHRLDLAAGGTEFERHVSRVRNAMKALR